MLERGSRDGYSTAVVEFLFDLVPEGESLVGRFFSFIFKNSYLTRAGNYWILRLTKDLDEAMISISTISEVPSSSNSKTA